MKLNRFVRRGLGLAAVCGGVAYAAPPAPCSLLTTQQVTAALGVPVGQGQAMGSTLCLWTQQGGSATAEKVYVTVLTAQGFQMFTTAVNDPAITKTPLSGIGDQAVRVVPKNQPGSVGVKKGDVYFSVRVTNVPAGEVQAKETALAKAIVAKL